MVIQMATLRTPVKFLDFLMDKMTKDLYMVLHEELHYVWVIKDGGGAAPFQMPKNKINLAFIKVDPKVARILYDDEEKTSDSDANNADAESSDSK
jgi:hypothetical protein